MDGEKFYDALRDAVNDVRASRVVAESSRSGTRENLTGVIGIRRNRDELTSLIARYPEEFAGLVIALAASANDTYAGLNERLAKLEVKVGDLEVENRTHARMDVRIERLEDAVSGLGDGV